MLADTRVRPVKGLCQRDAGQFTLGDEYQIATPIPQISSNKGAYIAHVRAATWKVQHELTYSMWEGIL